MSMTADLIGHNTDHTKLNAWQSPAWARPSPTHSFNSVNQAVDSSSDYRCSNLANM